MYGKIFASIYDGTLVEDWRALVTFQQLIVLCDSDGVIDMTPSAISRRTGIPIEHIKAGIEVLEQPDPWSRTTDEEGRRLIRLDEHRQWGWKIVNHNKYKGLQNYDTIRQQYRERQRRRREKLNQLEDGQASSRNVTDSHVQSRHTDRDTDTGKDLAQKRFDKFWSAYPKKKSKGQAEKAWHKIKPDEQLFQQIMAGLEQAKRSADWQKDDGKFIPYPATWLNAKGWEDEYQPQSGQPEDVILD